MAAADLPLWAQSAGIVGTILGSSILAIWAGRRAGAKEPQGEATVVHASFADTKSIKALTDSIEEGRREIKHLREAVEDHRDAVRENTAAIRENTDSTGNLLHFITRGMRNDR